MSDYVYKDPCSNGFVKSTLTTKQHNELIIHAKKNWKVCFEYYYNDDHVIIHRFSSIWLKILITITFPLVMLFEGLSNYKDIFREYKEMYNEKKYGSFVSDIYWCRDYKNTYTQLIKMLVK